MQEKWTLIEAQSQYCSPSVVGTVKHYHPLDTLQHSWTEGDAQAGRCIAEEVGTSRLPPFAALLPPADYRPPEPEPEPEIEIEEEIEPISASDRAAILDGLLENSLTSKTQAEFNAWAKANAGVYHTMLAKHNLARSMKEAPKALPDLDDLSDEQIEGMSSSDLKRILLKHVGITKKSQLD